MLHSFVPLVNFHFELKKISQNGHLSEVISLDKSGHFYVFVDSILCVVLLLQWSAGVRETGGRRGQLQHQCGQLPHRGECRRGGDGARQLHVHQSAGGNGQHGGHTAHQSR